MKTKVNTEEWQERTKNQATTHIIYTFVKQILCLEPSVGPFFSFSSLCLFAEGLQGIFVLFCAFKIFSEAFLGIPLSFNYHHLGSYARIKLHIACLVIIILFCFYFVVRSFVCFSFCRWCCILTFQNDGNDACTVAYTIPKHKISHIHTMWQTPHRLYTYIWHAISRH